ncbi:kinetochore protein Nuf2 [Cryptococcus deuterogattii 99/473]|uniref:Kinetochore protein Nuf2 n=5 Tax=Cryptococcus gattii species complex TaxID=1884637 RepID=A0A0D0V4W2_9TREE|nr:kinetochore protein Nuf2 [Cryptococcus deuterogattii LA55]KIR35705.1 kinetochore protein Nuf2 [Cryptococcus deuterogattii MMRL2647]KIR42436.1 kinetochore protein Nuf2 [Cryptococcus deuterogattii Ram5]KIR72739.1 kinetochore protein Nuf2 [Cryptococcus deuterogattii CA1014]KIR95080.1 kinetochore protein Nuf2 [Cryptococcus deuterogattii CBS 10090]KIS00398.1 kinetochore protein Nuf2 [Cryptococcus deuterogattii 2001/935-1]KIY59840.1 kinetochore protein Nuf2 [Cryptococcus deuterogattii 99/473]
MSQQNRRVQQNTAAFPLLTAHDILECLAALDIPAQMEDLTKPTAQSTQSIYGSLLEVLMGASISSIEGPKQALLGMMEYKEMYSDTLQFMMFFKHCRRLALLCGIPDFAISDLARPDPNRLRKVLSGIMNFAKFRDERMQTQTRFQENLQKYQKKAVDLRRKTQELEIQFQEITARNAAERPQSEQAGKRNELLKSELLELNSQRLKEVQEYEELKKERQTLLEQVNHNNRIVTQLELQIGSAKSRLVQSPDRIKRHISEMSFAIQSEKAKLASFQQKTRELTNRLEVIGALEVDLRGLIDLEHSIQDQRAKTEEAKRSKSALEARLEGRQIESQGLAAKLEQLQRQLQNASHKLARQEETRKSMRERGARRIDELKAEERGEWQKQRDDLLAEQKELESEMAAFVTKHENEINEFLHAYWTMRRQAEDYMNTMTVKLGLQVQL